MNLHGSSGKKKREGEVVFPLMNMTSQIYCKESKQLHSQETSNYVAVPIATIPASKTFIHVVL